MVTSRAGLKRASAFGLRASNRALLRQMGGVERGAGSDRSESIRWLMLGTRWDGT